VPFPKQTAKAFTRANILALKPGRMGCYGLFGDRRMIYIGQGDIRARLLGHINGDKPCISSNAASHWVEVVTDHMDYEEKRLIQEYNPCCNKKAG
jgi:hypothetical protein